MSLNILTLGIALSLLLYFGIVLWMLLEAVWRSRGRVRWQALLYYLSALVVPVWLFRRRPWPATVEVNRWRQLRLLAIAACASFVLSSALASLGWFVTTNLFQAARVEGQAMSPTINDQDRLIVNKAVFRAGDPAIGDIVMMRYPKDPRKSFVKRVIASGGDELQIVNGVVFRNGDRLDEPYLVETNRSHDDWGPEVVPDGTYFVMGDRRNNSSDSRHWGFVPREYILGRVTTRWWPLSARRRF